MILNVYKRRIPLKERQNVINFRNPVSGSHQAMHGR